MMRLLPNRFDLSTILISGPVRIREWNRTLARRERTLPIDFPDGITIVHLKSSACPAADPDTYRHSAGAQPAARECSAAVGFGSSETSIWMLQNCSAALAVQAAGQGSRKSISLRRDPEAFFPGPASGNRLELLINPLLLQVQRVRDAGHWLERDEALCRRRSRTLVRRHCRRGNPHALSGLHGKRPGGRGCGTTSAATTGAATTPSNRGERRGP